MGSNIGVDRGHGQFADVFDEKKMSPKKADAGSVPPFHSVVKGWRFFLEEKTNVVNDAPIHVSELSSDTVKQSECYLIIHTYQLGGASPANGSGGVAEGVASAVAAALEDALTPRGRTEAFSGYDCSPLAYQSIFRVSKKDMAHDAYLWNGKKASALVKAGALSKGFQMERFLVNSSGAGIDSFLFNSSSVVPIDNLLPSAWKDNKNTNQAAVMANHLLRSLLSGAKGKGLVGSGDIPHVREAFVLPAKEEGSEEPKAKVPGILVPEKAGGAVAPVAEEKPEPLFKPAAPVKPGMNKVRGQRMALNLDLSTVSKASAEKDEKKQKQEKLDLFSKQINKISDHVYMGGDLIARDKETLKNAGITHVLNCAGNVCDNYFPGDFCYRTFYLKDGAGEDISLVFYEVIDFIEGVIDEGGRVFVHCYQGVSRSSAAVIVHMMWREKVDYDTAFKHVKGIRGIANPNTGFMMHLMNWSNNRKNPSNATRLLRISSHNDDDPLFLVARSVPAEVSSLDSRGSFLLVTKSATYVWLGEKCSLELAQGAVVAALRLGRYEDCSDAKLLKQGSEGEEFWGALGGQGEVGESTQKAYLNDYSDEAKLPRSHLPSEASTMDAIMDVVQVPPSPGAGVRTDDGSPLKRKELVDQDQPHLGTSSLGNQTSRIRTSSVLSPRIAPSPSKSRADEPRMFEYPNWHQLSMFDSDDLDETGAFGIVLITADKKEITLWMGAEFQSDVLDDERNKLGHDLAIACLVENGLPQNFEVQVIMQDEEPDEFWDLFVNG